MAEVDETANEAEDKHSINWGAFLFWPFVALIVYVLTAGPLVMMVDKGTLSGKSAMVLERIYSPIEWAYDKTWLHKPIGMYLHLWSKRFDKHGDQK